MVGKQVVLFGVALLVSGFAFAEKKEVWHGWTDMPGIPCTKEFTYKDDFGIPWPSVRTAPQEHHTRIFVDTPAWAQAEQSIKECALIAAGVSGAAAFLASPSSAWPAFKASFKACLVERSIEVAEDSVSIEMGTECRW